MLVGILFTHAMVFLRDDKVEKVFEMNGCSSSVALKKNSSLVGSTLILALLLVTAIPSMVYADAALDDYNTAVGLYKQSRWKPAADQFRAFLKANEKHEKAPFAKLYLGLTLVNLSDFKGARDELRGFVKENPQNPNLAQARYRIAECSYLLNELDAARSDLESYLRDFPTDNFHDHAVPYLADVQLRQNDPAAALASFEKAIQKFPAGPLIDDARFGRARSLELLKRDDEAVAQYKELAASKNSPRAPDAQFHVAANAFERKQLPEAAAAYLALIKEFPGSRHVPAAHLNAGYALYQTGRFSEAAEQFESAAKEKSQSALAGYWRGLSLKSLGQLAQAVDVFKSASQSAGDASPADAILFQQALCERQLGRTAESRQLFDVVLAKWGAGEYGDDSLHALAEMAIESGDLGGAEQSLNRFAKDYASSGLRIHAELLWGRLELSRAAVKLREQRPTNEIAAHYVAAANRFELVMKDSTIPKTKGQARYYLAFARQLQGEHAKALELIAPLVDQVIAEGAKSEFGDALVLQAESFQAEKKYPEAIKIATTYSELFPKGRQAARAFSIQAIASTRLNDLAKADSAIAKIDAEFPEHPLRTITTQQLAEMAEAREDWGSAARFYTALIPLAKTPESQPYAIRGLAWAQAKQKQPAAAAETYERVLKEFGSHKIAPECAYYRAEALGEAGDVDASVKAFDAILKQITPEKPAEPGIEQQTPWLYSYRAGQQVARIHRKAKHIDEADAAYRELTLRFPKPMKLDRLLDEWALLNYEAERFDKADELFRRLVNEVPDSDLADNAKLSLAESDLIAEKLDVARKAFEELVASEKSDADVKERSLYQLLVLAVDQQRWTEVRTLADQLIAGYPTSLNRWYANYAVAESILANFKATEQDLELARQRLTGLHSEKSNAAIAGMSWFDRIWVLLAEVSFRQKKYDELETIVAELRQRTEKSPFLHQAEEVLGRGYKQQAPPKFDEARNAFERVVSDPAAYRTETAAKSQFLIGETFFLQEKWPQAFIAYQKVYNNYAFPDWQAAALLQSAKCDEQQQQWKEAVATYSLLLEKFPNSIHVAEAKLRLEAATKKVMGN